MVSGTEHTTEAARWMSVGSSTAIDSQTAAREAAGDALTGSHTTLPLVFASIAPDPHRLAEGLRAAAPGVPVIGCSAHGGIHADGPRDGSVVVTALGGRTGHLAGVRRQTTTVVDCRTSARTRPHRRHPRRHAGRGTRLGDSDRENLLSFAEHVSLALADAKARRDMDAARHDALTGLAGPAPFQERLRDHLTHRRPLPVLPCSLSTCTNSKP
jgi:FIST-like protein